MAFLAPYESTIILLGLTGFLFFLQLLFADIVNIKSGHPPGVAVEQSHKSLLFRSNRAFANSNESIGILILFVMFAIFSSASPAWVNGSMLVYFVGRVAHMMTYYLNYKLMRSIAFTIACIGLVGIFGAGVAGYF